MKLPVLQLLLLGVARASTSSSSTSNLVAIRSTTSTTISPSAGTRASPPPAHSSEFATVKEILDLEIKGPNNIHNPLFSNIDLSQDELVVEFRYGNQDQKRQSTILKQPNTWRSNALLLGLVNSHISIDANAPSSLFCSLIVRGKPILPTLAKIPLIGSRLVPHRPDRILGTAEFTSKDLSSMGSNVNGRVSAALRGTDGRTMPYCSIDIDLVQKQWRDIYTNSNVMEDGEMEPFFKLTSASFVSTIEGNDNKPAWQLEKTVDPANPDLEMISPLPQEVPGFHFPVEDEFDPVPNSVIVVFKLLEKLKFQDTLTSYENRDAAIYELRQSLQTNIIAPKEGRWDNPTRDHTMKRIFFSCVGMHLIERNKGFEKGYVADMSNLGKYKIRTDKHKYDHYGCKTYFDDDGNIVKIEDLDGSIYRPGDEHWEWAKLKSRTAVFVMAAFIHLGDVHYVLGNYGATALRKYLPPTHPFRRALTPHFYKTHHTCRRAEYSLFSEFGLLSRGLSFAYEGGLKQFFIDQIGGYKFKRYADEIKERGLTDCHFHVGANDGVDLFNIFHEYIADLIAEIYSSQDDLDNDEDMKRSHEYLVKMFKATEYADFTLANVKVIWAEVIFRVTGFHNSSKLLYRLSTLSENVYSPCI